MDEAENAIREEIRALRVDQGRSQDWLAEQMRERGYDMHQTTIARVERTDGKRRPLALGEAIALCDVLGVPLQELLRAQSVDTAVARAQLDDAIRQLADESLTPGQFIRLTDAAMGLFDRAFKATDQDG